MKAFSYAGVTSQKKTHVGRRSGAKKAELKGISEDQIRQAGRWNQEQMTGCYLHSLPRKFMHAMAGHPPQIGCFEIRRAGVAPPDILLSMIWPELDHWRDRFGSGIEQENKLGCDGHDEPPLLFTGGHFTRFCYSYEEVSRKPHLEPSGFLTSGLRAFRAAVIEFRC